MEPFVLSDLQLALLKVFAVIWFWFVYVVVSCSNLLMKMVTRKVWISMVLYLFRHEVWMFVYTYVDLSMRLILCALDGGKVTDWQLLGKTD